MIQETLLGASGYIILFEIFFTVSQKRNTAYDSRLFILFLFLKETYY